MRTHLHTARIVVRLVPSFYGLTYFAFIECSLYSLIQTRD